MKFFDSSSPRLRRVALLAGAGVLALLLAGSIAWWSSQPALTRLVEGDPFREEMDKQTSKGLHFTGHYEGLKRTGTFVVESPRFVASDGVKTIASLDAKGLRGVFNPWGVFLRRWQFDRIDIESAKVGIQVYEPKPEVKPPKPWYAIFLPERVYLKEVVAAHADLEWKLRGKQSGFRDTRLVITPYGRDFEYRATGGTFQLPGVPKLETKNLHMLVTKERLTLYELNLAPPGTKEAGVSLKAKAGLKDDKRIEADLNFEKLPVAAWIPESWEGKWRGLASGKVRWEGDNPKLETSRGEGEIRADGTRVSGAKILNQLAVVTGREEVKSLTFDTLRATVQWKYPAGEIRDVEIEAKGVMRLEGRVTVESRKLGGKIELGIHADYLKWLPKATEEIFTKSRGGYHWTTVHLSGTVGKPREDLSERVKETIKESPGAMLGLLFRQAGEWLDHAFGD